MYMINRILPYIELNNIASVENFLSIFNQSHIDDIFSMIHNFQTISESNQRLLVETYIDVSNTALSNVRNTDLSIQEQNSIKIITYFLVFLATKAENTLNSSNNENISSITGKKTSKKSSKKSSLFDWNDWNERVLDLLLLFLELDQSKLWKMSLIKENFLSCIWNIALQMIENRPNNVLSHDKSVKRQCIHIISLSLRYFGNSSNSGLYSTLSTSFIDCLLRCEHMAIAVAEICTNHSSNQQKNKNSLLLLNNELMNEISQMNFSQVSLNGIKNIGLFIESFAKYSGYKMIAYLPMMMKQLDCSAHQIRLT